MTIGETTTEIEFDEYRLDVKLYDREHSSSKYTWYDDNGDECSKSESIEKRGRYRVNMTLYYTYTQTYSKQEYLVFSTETYGEKEDFVASSCSVAHTIGGAVSQAHSGLIEEMESEISDEKEWEQDVDTFESCIDAIDMDRVADVADQITAGEEYG